MKRQPEKKRISHTDDGLLSMAVSGLSACTGIVSFWLRTSRALTGQSEDAGLAKATNDLDQHYNAIVNGVIESWRVKNTTPLRKTLGAFEQCAATVKTMMDHDTYHEATWDKTCARVCKQAYEVHAAFRKVMRKYRNSGDQGAIAKAHLFLISATLDTWNANKRLFEHADEGDRPKCVSAREEFLHKEFKKLRQQGYGSAKAAISADKAWDRKHGKK